MNDLRRIEEALSTIGLDSEEFERCAQHLLSEVYPGLNPMPRGTDWGRDADVPQGAAVPLRVLITSSRDLDGIKKNMLGGIRSMREHKVAVERIALANPADLSNLQRQKLVTAANEVGVRLDPSEIFGQRFIADRLRRDAYWRERLLRLPAAPLSLMPHAPDIADSRWHFLPLVAREEELRALAGTDDLIVTGPPGVGKSRLLSELDDVAFVSRSASREQIERDLRSNPVA